MPPEGRSTNIRVFIKWDDQTIFAGEELKCHITFKNVAPGHSRLGSAPAPATTPTSINQRQPPLSSPRAERQQRQSSPLLSPRAKSNSNGLIPPAFNRSHRSTLSLNVTPASSRLRGNIHQWGPPLQPPAPLQTAGSSDTHKRSLSIVSIGSNASIDDPVYNHVSAPRHSARGHGRSSSLHIVPHTGLTNTPQSAVLPRRSPFGSDASPMFNNHSFPPSNHDINQRPGTSASSYTPSLTKSPPRGKVTRPMPDFKFPMTPGPSSSTASIPDASRLHPEDPNATPTAETPQVALPVRSKDTIPTISEHVAPVARILSTTSMAGGTPRSSGEFYSLSNNSSETLASEYVTHPFYGGRAPSHLRRNSAMSGIGVARLPESLMMGYAQVQGSFTLDGSLVNIGPFEAVKRKAILGGQGGGVIGVESSRRSGGFLTGFGWGGLGNSIGELLGGSEFSSIKDMRGAASSKSIPLLSTPQSILFVDLQLGPGESRTYEYSFKLPKGLPPTHRGKAIKITYSLIVGTQRAGGAKEQQVRSVDIPFRVLGSVNSYGEILGHDLLSPYIILRDQAKVQPQEKTPNPSALQKQVKHNGPNPNVDDFLSYVNGLLDHPHNGLGLTSPTATAEPSRRSSVEGVTTAKQAIDLAILRSNMTSESGQSNNRFEIARNGQRVGVVMLARPSYRLGETVSMVIDFSRAEIPCYAVHAVLESSERVDPSLAIRSEASIHRVTRKVYASSSEATLFTRRVVFNPTIPITATPEFVTSGLSLEWKIRIEFVVSCTASGEDQDDQETTNEPRPLLEEVSRTNRGGLIFLPAETMGCESFEVAVPLRVYGAVCNGLERLERDEALDEGLRI